MLSVSKFTPLFPLEISAGFFSEFVAVLSSKFLSVLSPVFVATWSFELVFYIVRASYCLFIRVSCDVLVLLYFIV